MKGLWDFIFSVNKHNNLTRILSPCSACRCLDGSRGCGNSSNGNGNIFPLPLLSSANGEKGDPVTDRQREKEGGRRRTRIGNRPMTDRPFYRPSVRDSMVRCARSCQSPPPQTIRAICKAWPKMGLKKLSRHAGRFRTLERHNCGDLNAGSIRQREAMWVDDFAKRGMEGNRSGSLEFKGLGGD